jgi:SSS family solute:Na+ symporter
MTWLDWLFISIPLTALVLVAVYTRRHMRSVADFLSGGRLAGRYLLAVAKGEQGVGAVVFVAMFEMISRSGFVLAWWGWLTIPVVFLVTVSGWVIYRFRETRAMTLAQFFEIRYSRKFRIFTGFLGFAAGLLNFGVIPAVGSRFLVYFLGLPPELSLGQTTIPTYIPLMALMLGLTLLLTLSGGLITLMITNCLEGIISQILFFVIIVALLCMFQWDQISAVLSDRPAGQSLLNPFDSFQLQDFNLGLILIGIWGIVYRNMAWQNQSAYTTAAVNAHESRMAGILGSWKGLGTGAIFTLLAVCAMTYLQHPDFAQLSSQAHADINAIADAGTREQLRIPIAVEQMLPMGIKGCLAIILLMGVLGGDGNHLHSWGSLLIQDVVVPLRRKPLSPRQQIRLLRWSIVGVAVFAFLFGCFFRQTEYLIMWWMVTEALYVGGAGVAIIGGLYWKKGTTAGAWSGLLTGSILITGGILARQIWGNAIPFNGAVIGFYGSLAACVVYVVVSWFTCREDYNMDRLLHRGAYASPSDTPPKQPHPLNWSRWVGLDSHFTRGDRWIAVSFLVWSMGWLAVLLAGCLWNLFFPWPAGFWSAFWHVVGIGIPTFFTLVTGIWFAWGGWRDMRVFFSRLREARPDPSDDGSVQAK